MKLTLTDIRSCFYGVPKSWYAVYKENGNYYVAYTYEMHKAYYGISKLYRNYDVEKQPDDLLHREVYKIIKPR